MSYSGRKCAAVSAVVFACLLLLAAQGLCEMIQAPVVSQPGENLQQSAERVKKQALQDALYKAALGVLPGGKIPAGREKALHSLLNSRQEQFISIAEVLDPGDSGGLLVMDVNIDTKSLSEALRLSGFYYTLTKKRPFQLDLQGASAEDKQELDALMSNSGLEPSVDVMPALKLSKEQGTWIASLNTGYGQFSEQGPQLGPLWTKIWAHYFASVAPPQKEEAPQNATASTQTVIIRGFSSPDKVYVLDSVFGKWKSLVSGYKLKKIDMNSQGIEGVWEVQLYDRNSFADRLEGYIANSGLTFGWDGGE